MRIHKSLTRLAAMQTIYKMVLCKIEPLQENVSDAANEIVLLYAEKEIFSESDMLKFGLEDLMPSQEFLLEFCQKTFAHQETIDKYISDHLAQNWTIAKLDTIIVTILRIAICELCYYETPTKVILDEYTSLASDFYDANRVGFVNGILDKISKQVRD